MKGAGTMYNAGHIFITQTGFQNLKDKLNELNRKQVQLGHELHGTKEPGHKLENGSYTSIWEQKQQLLEDMQQISTTLRSAELIKKPTRKSWVRLGNNVRLKCEDEVRSYTIVDSLEADPSQGKISYHSPAGNDLLGKRVGEQVEIGDGHKKTFTVLEIS